MGKLKKWALLCLAGLFLLLGVFFGTKHYFQLETQRSVSAETMRESLRDIGELASEAYAYTEVGTHDSKKSAQIFGYEVIIPLTQSKFIYSYDGTIKAGIDFTQVQVDKDETAMRVTVTLPEAVILSSELDEDSFRLYDEQSSIFNPIRVSDVNATNQALKETAEARAVKNGLLDRAADNAKRLITEFLQSAYDMSQYTLTVKTAQ